MILLIVDTPPLRNEAAPRLILNWDYMCDKHYLTRWGAIQDFNKIR